MKDSDTLDLSVICLAYNGEDLLRRCLRSVLTETRDVRFELIVVDNNSPDDDIVGMVRREFPQVTLIANHENLGVARGNNIAIRRSDARYVVLLNPDTMVLPYGLDKMVRFLDSRTDIAVLGSPLVTPEGEDQGVSGRAYPTAFSYFFGRTTLLTHLFPNNPISRKLIRYENPVRREPSEVDWVSGACMMVRRDAIEGVGLLDEAYFMYWEDTDWCYRFKKAGWKIYCFHEVGVTHVGGGSSRDSIRPIIYFHRSAYQYYRKHINPAPFHLLHPIAVLGLAARAGGLILMTKLKALFIHSRTGDVRVA